MTHSKVTVVLVHGACAERASWSQVILPPQKQGLGVVCAPIPLTSLGDDVGALDRVLGRIEGDIVLVGHAYAGAVIGATANERVKATVRSHGVDHSPMVSAPGRVVEVLLEAIRAHFPRTMS